MLRLVKCVFDMVHLINVYKVVNCLLLDSRCTHTHIYIYTYCTHIVIELSEWHLTRVSVTINAITCAVISERLCGTLIV